MKQQNTETQLLLNIPQVAARLGLGRTKVYELIATEGLPVVRFGRAVRVSAISLQRWVEQREKDSLSA
jgi:excisionase family DNA binding protein